MSARLTDSAPWRPAGPRLAVPLPVVESLDASEQAEIAYKAKLMAQQQLEADAAAVSEAGSSAEEDDVVEQEQKYDDEELLHTRTPLLHGADVNAKREEIRSYFHRTFSLYEKLFDVLATEDTFLMQPDKLRHPLIFYFGHTAGQCGAMSMRDFAAFEAWPDMAPLLPCMFVRCRQCFSSTSSALQVC